MKKRLNVGLLVDDIINKYQNNIWRGIVSKAEEKDINLICFPIKRLGSNILEEKQSEVLYKLISKKNVDGLIILSATLLTFITKEELKNFLNNFSSLPLVSVGLRIDSIPSICVDEASGLQDLLIHLIEYHHFHRIAFIKGPEKNWEAIERYETYRKILEIYNIPFDPQLIIPGSFLYEDGIKGIKTLFDERKVSIESIVSSNDDMAIGAIRELKLRGIKVPDNIAVVGYDDTEESRFCDPPLTTVHQPLFELGEKSVEIILDLIKGEKIPEITLLPTYGIIRESCGCKLSKTLQREIEGIRKTSGFSSFDIKKIFAELEKEFSQEKENTLEDIKEITQSLYLDIFENSRGIFLYTLENFLEKRKNTFEEIIYVLQKLIKSLREKLLSVIKDKEIYNYAEDLIHQGRTLIEDFYIRSYGYERVAFSEEFNRINLISQQLITAFDLETLKDAIFTNLPMLSIPSFYLSLYEEKVYPSKFSRLILGYNKGEYFDYHKSNGKRFLTLNLAPKELLPNDRRFTIIVKPIFFKEKQFGFALFEVGPLDGVIYENLATIIGGALQGYNLFQERLKAEEDLKRSMEELDILNNFSTRTILVQSLEDLGKLIYEEINKLISVNSFYFSFYEPDKKEFKYITNIFDAKLKDFYENVNRKILRNKKPLILEDKDRKIKNFIGVPVLIKEKPIGILAIQDFDDLKRNRSQILNFLVSLSYQTAISIENILMLEKEHKRVTLLSLVNEIGSKITSNLNIDVVLEEVVKSLSNTLGYHFVSIFLLDETKDRLTLKATNIINYPFIPEEYSQSINIGILGYVARTKKYRLVKDTTKESHYFNPLKEFSFGSELALPIKFQREIIGVLNIESLEPYAFDEIDISCLRILADQIAIAINNAHLFEKTKKLATIDSLTELWNRRYLEEALKREIALAKRYNNNLAILMIDVDNFKLINDNYGHNVGDEVLKMIANTLKSSCRETDIVGRYGGDEFVVILPNTAMEGARIVSERILENIKKISYKTPDGTKIPISLSIGIASYPTDAETLEKLVSLADTAMYRAKIEGGKKAITLSSLPSKRKELTEISLDTLMALIINNKDSYTYKHCQEVAKYATYIAKELNLPEEDINLLEIAAKIHDIGKIGIPLEILKKPGPLTSEEWEVIKDHPRLGYLILEQIKIIKDVLEIVLYHHERYDGKGYPQGLKNEEIPLLARIIAIADAYSAMKTDRPYRKALSKEEILEELKLNAGKQFDPYLVERFIKLIEEGKIES